MALIVAAGRRGPTAQEFPYLARCMVKTCQNLLPFEGQHRRRPSAVAREDALSTETELWALGQQERYRRALDQAWEDFEEVYYTTVKRVGLQSMAAMHAKRYRERGRMIKSMADGLLARPTRTGETPDAIRKAVAELIQFKRNLNDL